jgi:hypothetical protein
MASTITVTTFSTIAATGPDTSFGIFCTIFLFVLLILQELLNAAGGTRKQYIARSLNLGIIPLLLSFLAILVLKVVEIMS